MKLKPSIIGLIALGIPLTVAEASATVSVARAADMSASASAGAYATEFATEAPSTALLLQQTKVGSKAPAKTTVSPAASKGAAVGKAPARGTAATTRRAVTPAPLRFTTPRGAEALTADLNSILPSRTRNGQWGAMVVSISRGDTLLSVNAGNEMLPASTMKLFTSAIALEKLGPEHSFSTDVLRDGSIDDNGVLHGDLILRGDGDPALSPRFVPGGPSAPMNTLAQFTKTMGITRVTGDIIADASAFEPGGIPEGWLSRYAGAGYAAPFSALSLNDNIIIAGVVPGAIGAIAKPFLEPETRAINVSSTVRTVAGSAVKISARLVADDRIVVSGTIGAKAAPARYQVVVNDPARFTAGAYLSALEEQGIKVDGALRAGLTPASAVILTSMPSPPLARIVSVMNRESINLFAEMLFRGAARAEDKSVVGSAVTAASTLGEFLQMQVGVPSGAVSVTDGSGLSVLDRVTPRSLVKLLDHAHRASWGSTFHASLPVAGESDLLKTRMRETPAQGNLHAKTGTTNDVVGLSGYVTAENGEILAFAFLYNGTDRSYARETIDAMGPTLAAFSRD